MSRHGQIITTENADIMEQYAVIIVDDEPYILQSMQRVFRAEPYPILVANTGAEALQLLAETPTVAVIISDQLMPDMNGTDFLTRSRAVAPDAFRMLLTGESNIEATIAAMNKGGATYYISKPWEEEELLQIVRHGIMQYHLLLENRRHSEIINEHNIQLLESLNRLTEQNTELERLASTDVLTGLTNRRRMFEYLEKEVSRIRRYGGTMSIIMFDIDHFKLVNDAWGHSVGDTVLQEVARESKSVLRKADIAARCGGEEFVILLPETELAGAVKIANRLRQQVADMVVLQEHAAPISVTISIGVAMIGPNAASVDLLIRADKAMYLAKKNGRNRVETADMMLFQETE